MLESTGSPKRQLLGAFAAIGAIAVATAVWTSPWAGLAVGSVGLNLALAVTVLYLRNRLGRAGTPAIDVSQWARRGQERATRGDTEPAIAAYESALILEPTELRLRLTLCQLLARQDRQEEAVAHAVGALAIAYRQHDQNHERSLVGFGRLVAAEGHPELAHRFFDAALGDPPRPGPALVARRMMPGYRSPIDAHLLDQACAIALGVHGGSGTDSAEHLAAEALGGGRGSDVDGMVRHRLAIDGRSVSLIQKSFAGSRPREIEVYRSGLVTEGGRHWRTPCIHVVAKSEDGRWHLLMEDLGAAAPPKTSEQVRAAAFAIGELGARYVGQEQDLREHSWLYDLEGIQQLWRTPEPASVRDLPEQHVPMRARIAALLGKLHEREADIDAVFDGLPVVLAHGDTALGNLMVEGGGLVLIDWGSARTLGVGADLAQVVMSRIVSHPRHVDPGLQDACLTAYGEPLQPHGVGRSDIELGYRVGLVRRVLRTKIRPIARLGGPSYHDARAPGPRGHRRLLADLVHICDEADHLLRSL